MTSTTTTFGTGTKLCPIIPPLRSSGIMGQVPKVTSGTSGILGNEARGSTREGKRMNMSTSPYSTAPRVGHSSICHTLFLSEINQ